MMQLEWGRPGREVGLGAGRGWSSVEVNWLGHLLLHQWEGPRASPFTGSWLELGKSIWESRILYPGPQASRQDLQGEGEGRHAVPAPTCPWQMPFWVCLVEAEPQTAGGKDSCRPETTWRRLAAGNTKQETPPQTHNQNISQERGPQPHPLFVKSRIHTAFLLVTWPRIICGRKV